MRIQQPTGSTLSPNAGCVQGHATVLKCKHHIGGGVVLRCSADVAWLLMSSAVSRRFWVHLSLPPDLAPLHPTHDQPAAAHALMPPRCYTQARKQRLSTALLIVTAGAPVRAPCPLSPPPTSRAAQSARVRRTIGTHVLAAPTCVRSARPVTRIASRRPTSGPVSNPSAPHQAAAAETHGGCTVYRCSVLTLLMRLRRARSGGGAPEAATDGGAPLGVHVPPSVVIRAALAAAARACCRSGRSGVRL
jgi:hypothetical protein